MCSCVRQLEIYLDVQVVLALVLHPPRLERSLPHRRCYRLHLVETFLTKHTRENNQNPTVISSIQIFHRQKDQPKTMLAPEPVEVQPAVPIVVAANVVPPQRRKMPNFVSKAGTAARCVATWRVYSIYRRINPLCTLFRQHLSSRKQGFL